MNELKILQVAAVNHVSDSISVIHSDAALLERGQGVRPLGVNIVTADIFDAGKRDTSLFSSFANEVHKASMPSIRKSALDSVPDCQRTPIDPKFKQHFKVAAFYAQPNIPL